MHGLAPLLSHLLPAWWRAHYLRSRMLLLPQLFIAAAFTSATRFAAFAAAISAGVVRVFLAAFFRGGVLSRLLSTNSSTMRLRRSYSLDRAAKSSANTAVWFWVCPLVYIQGLLGCHHWEPKVPRSGHKKVPRLSGPVGAPFYALVGAPFCDPGALFCAQVGAQFFAQSGAGFCAPVGAPFLPRAVHIFVPRAGH